MHQRAPMILSTVRLAISARDKPEVLRTLRVLMGCATSKAGCAGFALLQDVINPETLTICDRWVTREDLDEHVRSADYRLLLAVIDLSLTPPDISFDALEHIGGLEVVEAVRDPQYSIRRDDGRDSKRASTGTQEAAHHIPED